MFFRAFNIFMKSSPTGPILQAGLLARALDGLAAALSYYFQTGKNPVNVFKSSPAVRSARKR